MDQLFSTTTCFILACISEIELDWNTGYLKTNFILKLLPCEVNSFMRPALNLLEMLENYWWRPLSFLRAFYVIGNDTSHW